MNSQPKRPMLEEEMVSLSRVAQIVAQNSEMLLKLKSAQQNNQSNAVLETKNVDRTLEAENVELMPKSIPLKDRELSAFEHQLNDASVMQKTDEDPKGYIDSSDNIKISNKVEQELTTRTKALRSRLEKLTNGD